MLIIYYNNSDWRDGSFGKMPAAQDEVMSSGLQHSCQKGRCGYLCNPCSDGEGRDR